MLVKQIKKITAPLRLILTQTASSQKPKGQQEIPITKHNPEADIDLRGHHNIDKLEEAQRDFSPFHSKRLHKTSAFYLASFLPNSVAKFIGKLAEDPKSTLASDALHLPKIYPEAVPVYDCMSPVNSFIIVNKIITLFTPALILVAVPEPTATLLLYSFGVGAYWYFNWKMVRNLVIKAELLPNTEEIVYQKLSFWGGITTHKAKIQDLEASSLEELYSQTDRSERSVRGLLNRQVAFTVKGTSERLFFDKNGIWHEEGINHSLLL